MASGKPIVSKTAPNLVSLINRMYSNAGKRFTAKELASGLTCKPNSVYLYIRAAALYYPDNVKKEPISRDGSHGMFVSYFWDDNGINPFDKEPIEEKNEDSSRKNGEGYSDRTASKAIENYEKATLPATTLVSSKYAGKDGHRPLPGDIWLTSTSSKAEEYFLVLANHDNTNTISGLRLSKETPAVKKLIPAPFDFSIVMDNDNVMIADASMVTYKWRKYMTKLVEAISDNDLNILKGKVRVSLGITEATRVEYVEKPVYKEKVVEKKVEVPVEKIVYVDKPVENETPKIPEGCISTKDAEFAMLVQERNIWKSVAENLMKRI